MPRRTPSDEYVMCPEIGDWSPVISLGTWTFLNGYVGVQYVQS